MNFYKLPVVSSVSVSNFETGSPFTSSAFKIAWYDMFDQYVGTDNGDVYAARIKNDLYFVSIGSGYKGYTWSSQSVFQPLEHVVETTDYSSIYAVKGMSLSGLYSWSIELTKFADIGEMLSMFYDTFIDTESSDGIVVKVIARAADPNDEAGNSGEDGGEGEHDDTSDPVPPPVPPSISGTNTGLVTLFRPTLDELQSLGSYLWTNITDFIENLNKMFVNPMDYLIALNIFPCIPDVGSARAIKIGSITSTINMSPVVSQWYEFDAGFIQIPEYWGSYLDYAPYTRISAMLPFIGSVQLNTDDVMKKQIGLRYRIDLLSGQCVALITVDGDVYYQYAGECAVAVPLTGSDWSRVYSATIGAIGTAVTGGMSAASAGFVANRASNAIASNAIGNAVRASEAFANVNATSAGVRGVSQMRQNLVNASNIALDTAANAASSSGRIASSVGAMRLANTIDATVGHVMSAKATVSHSGTISGSASMLGVRTPYVLLEYPNQSLPDNYKHFVGYPSNMYARLGTLSGYTECEQVFPSGLSQATDTETAELIEALKGGVYL